MTAYLDTFSKISTQTPPQKKGGGRGGEGKEEEEEEKGRQRKIILNLNSYTQSPTSEHFR